MAAMSLMRQLSRQVGSGAADAAALRELRESGASAAHSPTKMQLEEEEKHPLDSADDSSSELEDSATDHDQSGLVNDESGPTEPHDAGVLPTSSGKTILSAPGHNQPSPMALPATDLPRPGGDRGPIVEKSKADRLRAPFQAKFEMIQLPGPFRDVFVSSLRAVVALRVQGRLVGQMPLGKGFPPVLRIRRHRPAAPLKVSRCASV